MAKTKLEVGDKLYLVPTGGHEVYGRFEIIKIEDGKAYTKNAKFVFDTAIGIDGLGRMQVAAIRFDDQFIFYPHQYFVETPEMGHRLDKDDLLRRINNYRLQNLSLDQLKKLNDFLKAYYANVPEMEYKEKWKSDCAKEISDKPNDELLGDYASHAKCDQYELSYRDEWYGNLVAETLIKRLKDIGFLSKAFDKDLAIHNPDRLDQKFQE